MLPGSFCFRVRSALLYTFAETTSVSTTSTSQYSQMRCVARSSGAVTTTIRSNCGRVIGSENLYVADASVMPRLPTANTNIPTMMIAEKISDALIATG